MRRLILSCGFALLVLAVVSTGASAMGKSRTAALQIGLRAKGTYSGTIDGVWGAATERAVRDLQRRARIPVDGVPGRLTRRALGRYGRPGFGTRVMGVGQVGWDVSQLQFLLAWHGFPSGPLDGAYGPRTAAAVRGFQGWARIGVDGVPGPATLRALRRPLPRAGIRLAWPVVIPPSDGFGPRGNRFHTGLDFPAGRGVPVAAAGAGRVVFAGFDGGGYGNLVVVSHRGHVSTWYAHLASIAVRRGGSVSAGARIGTVGATGRATGPHLHFEVRVRGAATNPLAALG